MHKHTKEVWRTAIIVVGCLFGLVLILSFFATPSNNSSNNDYSNPSEQENLVRDITISGVGQTETIQDKYPVYLILSGSENTITIHPDTEIKDIVLSGVDNKVILCEGIHDPNTKISGVRVDIIYRTC